MNIRKLVAVTNIIGMVSTVILIYWVFIFSLSVVFELNIFQEKITAIFGMSVLGILALMVGTLMLNIMFNLTRIAEQVERRDAFLDNIDNTDNGKKQVGWFLLMFPILAALMFGGDYWRDGKKREVMFEEAKYIVRLNPKESAQIATVHFDFASIQQAETFAKNPKIP